MSAKNGKFGKEKIQIKNVCKKRENGKSAARMRPYLVFETRPNGKAHGKQKKISPFCSKCLQKSGKWERRAGKCGKKRKEKRERRHTLLDLNFHTERYHPPGNKTTEEKKLKKLGKMEVFVPPFPACARHLFRPSK